MEDSLEAMDTEVTVVMEATAESLLRAPAQRQGSQQQLLLRPRLHPPQPRPRPRPRPRPPQPLPLLPP